MSPVMKERGLEGPKFSAMHTAATGSRKNYQNAVHSKLLPVQNALLRIQEPPPRSPTPPTEVIVRKSPFMDSAHSLDKDFQPHCGGGNRFTQADKDYFIKFLCWSLKQDPSLRRGKLLFLGYREGPGNPAYWTEDSKFMIEAEGQVRDTGAKRAGIAKALMSQLLYEVRLAVQSRRRTVYDVFQDGLRKGLNLCCPRYDSGVPGTADDCRGSRIALRGGSIVGNGPTICVSVIRPNPNWEQLCVRRSANFASPPWNNCKQPKDLDSGAGAFRFRYVLLFRIQGSEDREKGSGPAVPGWKSDSGWDLV
ncbi:hypothetical protein B0H14DRAFT_3776415 [Mycena olivaceomarginata]|nr:hypothetical protein B0H14DRAFT_3776415 [Mycena olivaceomarginata]